MLEKLLLFFLKLMPKPIKEFFYKNESVLRYCYYGAWTTVVSVITKIIGKEIILVCGHSMKEVFFNTLNTTVSWIITVAFAFVVNKKYVFNSETKTKSGLLYEIGTFFGARFATYFLEVLIMDISVAVLGFNYYVMTVLSQFLILAINYVFSKLVVFRKGKSDTNTEKIKSEDIV